MLERILGFLLATYILYGLGFAVGLKGDEEVNFLSFLMVVMFWPFFKGLEDGAAI
jgi:hypothetical protein